MRLHTQVFLATVAGLAAVVALIVGLGTPRWQAELEEGARQRGRAVAGMLAHACAEPAMVGNYSELQRTVDEAARDEGVAYVAVVDREGRVVVSSGDERGRPHFVLEAPPPDPAGVLARAPAGIADAKTVVGGEPVIDFAAPLAVFKRSWGLVRLGLSLAGIREATRSVAWRMALLGGAGLAIGAVVSVLLALGITRPLARLAEAARGLSERRLDARVRVGGARELVQVGTTFNEMAASLQRHVAEIQEKSAELEAGYRVLARLSTTIDREALMEGVLEVVGEVLGARRCEVTAYDRQRGVMEVFARGPEGFVSTALAPREFGADGFERVPSFSRLVREHAQLGPDDLFVPLAVEGLDLGGLAAQPQPGRAFGPTQRKLAAGVSNHLLAALENARLYELAIRDGLTGLTIRRYFLVRLQQELDRARRYGQPFCVLMIDIDHFKKVNDDHGHPAGDLVLRAMAGRLAAVLRSSDLLSRYGGEELVLLLPAQDRESGRAVAERLRETVAARPFRLAEGGESPVTISVGVAAFPRDGRDGEGLVEAADRALYAAKQGGRNRVEALP
jgi:diguanylate cyclase (GGDEF)-like protein